MITLLEGNIFLTFNSCLTMFIRKPYFIGLVQVILQTKNKLEKKLKRVRFFTCKALVKMLKGFCKYEH